VTYCDLNGHSEIPHGFVFDRAVGRPQMLTPFYYFKNEQQSVRFQSAARQRQLLHTFPINYIQTRDRKISYGQQLKLWQKPDGSDVTFTFFAHMGGVDPRHHYEFDLLWFKQDAKRNGKGLVLTFYTPNDERKKSVDGKAWSLFKRHTSTDNHHSNGHRPRRTSSHSRSSSASSNQRALPDGDRTVSPNSVYLNWRTLHIEFVNDHGSFSCFCLRSCGTNSTTDAEQFLAFCHEPDSASGPSVAHESIWKISHGFEETLHLLEPISGSYTSSRRPSHISSATPGEDSAVYVSNLKRCFSIGTNSRLGVAPATGLAVYTTSGSATFTVRLMKASHQSA
jgi:hypothetical protein